MNKTFCYFLFTCLLFYNEHPAFAQINDAGLWVSVNLDKKITQKFSLNLTEEIRFNENVSELGMALTEIGAEYKFYKSFAFGVSYRFAQRRRVDDFYSMRHRYSFQLSFKHKIEKLSFTLTEKYQMYYADVNTSENGKIPELFLRTKLLLKYDLEKKYTPYASCELFYFLNKPDGSEFVAVRYVAGFKYEFNKKVSLDLFYLIDKEFHVNDPLTYYVSGVGFDYSF